MQQVMSLIDSDNQQLVEIAQKFQLHQDLYDVALKP